MNILQNILLIVLSCNFVVAAVMVLLYIQFSIEDKKMKKELEEMYDEYYGQDKKSN